MRKIVLYTIIVSLTFALSTFGQARIEITVEDIQDSIAYLGYHFGDKRYVSDTVFVEGTKCLFQSDSLYAAGLYFLYTPSVYFEFIVNEAEIVLKTAGPDYVKNMEVITSNENRVFFEMQKFVSAKRKELKEVANKIDSLETDSLLVVQNMEARRNIDVEVKEYQNRLAEQHPGSFVSRMIYIMQRPGIPESLQGTSDEIAGTRYHYYKQHFFDNISLSDASLLRTPIYQQKIMEYLDQVIIQDPDSVIREVDFILKAAERSKEVFRYMLVTLSSKYETSAIMGHDKVFVHIVEKYYLNGTANWMSEEVIRKLKERIATIKPNFIGNPAPPLILNDTLYTKISLYDDIHADYTILYFYDPDCGHCKKKTPVLYEAYGNLRNKNVEVLAINITNNEDRWKEYIQENQFDWINLADSFNQTNFRFFYDVRTTPTLYILDKNKQIIAKKLDTSQVEEFINNHINRNSRGATKGSE